ncbi:NUDIX domain-containing protein [Kitasatospora sp. NPDC057223]|uniref:NUDIX domain-containing protein n=1 Tax=Kitasatospora sp. NPDC057223 TaxID=3346055 RepID=UPI00364021BD
MGNNVERGENPLQAAVHECTEETGINLWVTSPGFVHQPRSLAVVFSPVSETSLYFSGGPRSG